MKTVTTNLYQYDELTDEAKEKVLEMLDDLNVCHDWWEFTYDDAKNIGLEITSFDTYRGEITGDLIETPGEVKKLVMKNHGKDCDTYKYVEQFDMRREVDEYEFKYGLLQEYLSILNKEYEYLTSQEAIEENIRANEYEFTSSGSWPVL